MLKKIKVAHIITKLELGGAQGNTLYTVSNLDKNMFDVLLICGKGGILDKDTKNINVYFIEKLVRSISPVSDIIAFCNIVKILKKEKPDIVHTHSSKAGIIGRWAARKAKVPFIIHTFHGFGFNEYQNWIKKRIYVFVERVTAKITDKLIFVSKENMKSCLENKIDCEGRSVLIRSGIRISDYRNLATDLRLKESLGIGPQDKVVTTIGPFKPQKNLLDFVDMAKIVTKNNVNKNNPIKFLLVGDGEQRGIIESRILNNELKDVVMLLGWRKDIPQILSLTNVFVMTSLWEGLPRSVVEALVSGVPVVAYAVDGTKEIIKNNENGYLINPGDVAALSGKVVSLLNEENTVIRFSEQAKKTIDSSFDIDFMVKQQENMYLNLTGTGK